MKKVWDDNNDAKKKRPLSIAMKLSNGMIVVLNEQNNWTATINNLPAVVNGKPVTYTWTEQTVLNYTNTGTVTEGTVTTFTNKLITKNPPPGKKTPPTEEEKPEEELEDYGTPMGVDVMINHVGDCFD